MKKNLIFSVVLITIIIFSMGTIAADYPEEVDNWLQEVKLGEYQEETIDYDQLYEAAKKEGKLIVYAGTSRMGTVAKTFMEKYPELEVESVSMSTAEVIEKYQREVMSGNPRADVVQASQAGRQLNVFYDQFHLLPWTPPDLKDNLTESQTRPLLHWRYGSRQWAYNNTYYEEEPFTSIWELTEEKWENRVIVGDPRLDGGTLDYFITVVVNADQMAEEYERLYGEKLELTTPNAGYEWIKRLFNNNPIIVKSEKAIPPVFGPKDAEDPPVGLISGSRFRDVGDPAEGNLTFYPTLNTRPSIGIKSIYPVGIAYKTENPNTAKLFVRFLFGNQEGEEGWAPFFVPGNWPVRDDITKAPEHKFAPEVVEALWPISELNLWDMQPDKVYRLQTDVLDFISDILF